MTGGRPSPWPTGEILKGLWRFESVHPEWDEDNDGWEAEVSWWAAQTGDGLVLIDPLPAGADWDQLDRLAETAGGCAGVIRTTRWHERAIPQAAERYGAAVWGRRPREDAPALPGGLVAHSMPRQDEIAVWLPEQRALIFGDVVIRSHDGTLRLCPDGWLHEKDGPQRLRAALRGLSHLPIEHALVSHGPPVLGGGGPALSAALGDPTGR